MATVPESSATCLYMSVYKLSNLMSSTPFRFAFKAVVPAKIVILDKRKIDNRKILHLSAPM